MAEPVSWAIISRRNGVLGFALSIGKLASMKNGVPYTWILSTAIERPGISGTPCAPTGSPSFDRPLTRKNTYERFVARTFGASSGLAAIQSRMRCIDIIFPRHEVTLDE